MSTQLHLVCAPDFLESPSVLGRWLVNCGDAVVCDHPLAEIDTAGDIYLMTAPMAGVLKELCLRPGDNVAPADLLAMIEADEDIPAFTLADGKQIPDDESVLGVPACRLGGANDDVTDLLLLLGLSPDDPGLRQLSPLTEDAVFRHVRDELRTLAAIRIMLGKR